MQIKASFIGNEFLSIVHLFVGITSLLILKYDRCDVVYIPAVILANLLLGFNMWFLSRDVKHGAFASFTVMFVFLFYLCHFLYQTFNLVGIIDYDEYIEYIEFYFQQATVFSLASFCFALFGVYSARLVNLRSDTIPPASNSLVVPDSGLLFKSFLANNLLLFLFFVVVVAEVVRIGPDQFFSSAYNDAFLMTQLSRFFDLGSRLFILSAIVCVALLPRKGTLKYSVFGAVLVTAYLLFFASWGYRGHLSVFVLAMYSVYAIRFKKLPSSVILVALLAGVFIWTVIGFAREYSLSDRSWSNISYKLEGKEFVRTAIRTTGQLIPAVSRAMHIFPSSSDYLYGRSYLDAVIYVIPNFGETAGRDLYFFGSEMSIYADIKVSTFGQIKGIGSTPVAEAYGNFGKWGVLVLFAFGFFVAKVESIAVKNKSAFCLAFYGVAMYTILWAMRNDFRAIPRQIVYGLIMLWTIKFAGRYFIRTQKQSS